MISRHKISRDVFTELAVVQGRFAKEQRKLTKRIEQGASVNFDGYKNTPLELALFLLMAAEKEEVRQYLTSHLELGVRHFQREFTSEPFLKVKLGENEFEIPSSAQRVGISLFDWWQLMNTSMILRSKGFEQELLTMFDSSANASGDPFWRRSMDLILMCLDRKQFDSSILNNIQSIVRSGVVEHKGVEGNGLIKSEEGKKIREALWLPIMTLYYYAYMGYYDKFNTELEAFLQSKRNWIIENKEEDNSSFWIDFPLLSCCAYAHDKGILIEVESDYIPSFLFKGEL